MESEAFDDLEKSTDALRTVKDLAAGAAGGMAQVLLGKWATLRGRMRVSDEASVALDACSTSTLEPQIHLKCAIANTSQL